MVDRLVVSAVESLNMPVFRYVNYIKETRMRVLTDVATAAVIVALTEI